MESIKINIKEPCHENWQNMSPNEQGRFCSSCQKQVIDFTNMNNKELYDTLLKGDANICGRFSEMQLGKAIDGDAEKRSAWHKYFFSFLVSAFLFTKQTRAQEMTGKATILPVCNTTLRLGEVSIIREKKHFTITGIISDILSKEPVYNASITIKNSGYGIISDSTGNFVLKGNTQSDKVILIISAAGYETKAIEIAIPARDFSISNEIIYLNKQVKELEDVVLRSTSNFTTSVLGGANIFVSKRNYYSLPKRIMTRITDSLKVYPNPVLRGNSFTVALKLRPKNKYTIQLINVSGNILLQRQIIAISNGHNEMIQADERWDAGIYFIRILNDKNKLISVSRFSIQ